MSKYSRAQAQNYVEYGLLIAVIVIAFFFAMNAMATGATTYLAHAEPTPNATVLAGLPNHAVAISMTCSPPAPPVYTGQPFNCSLTVTDITTIEPGRLPTGTMAFSSAANGTFNPSPCALSGSGVTSGCTFQYTPTNYDNQDITATYHPTSNHQLRSAQLPAVAWAVDKTQTTVLCAPSVPVGEPSQCVVGVYDLYPPRNGYLPGLSLVITTTTAAPGAVGTFSDERALSPQTDPYPCVTDAALSCGTLFRSGANPQDQTTHSVLAAFGGSPDYDQSNNYTTPDVISVAPPTQHPVKVDVTCDAGVTPQSPVQINLGGSTNCVATVTDVKPVDSNNNPTNVMPTGTVSWTASPDSGGTGSLSSTSCNLQRLNDMASQCQLSYTPNSVGTPAGPGYFGTHQIGVTYSTDWIHPNVGNDLQGSTNVYVTDQHRVQVSVNCSAGTNRALPLLIQGASADTTQCNVTVKDVNPSNQLTPTGTVAWTLAGTDGMGAFAPSTPCQLQPAGNATAQCQAPVTYQPTSRGTPDGPDQESTHTLVGTYSGDWLHPQVGDQTGSTDVFVGNLHIVTITVSCAPPTSRVAPLRVSLAQTTACTVSVVDPGPSPVTPTGSVGWAVASVGPGGAGTLTPSAVCTLQSAGPVGTARCPAETYRPTARGAPDGGGPDTDNTHNVTATYSGDGLHPPPNGVDQTFTVPIYVNN